MNTIEGTAVRVEIGDDSQPSQELADAAGLIFSDDKLTKIFVRIRDAKKAFVKAHEAELEEKFDKPLRQLSTELKQRCMAAGNTGLKNEYGTVYLAEAMKVSCQDWSIFYSWGKQNDCLENFLEQRVKVGEVKTYMEKHGGELPPGISVFRELEARVRKPKKPGTAAPTDDE